MRLWSIHPRYLDAKGLVALWREALLAQKVLQGLTRGYRRHPQLIRFRNTADPDAAVGGYLRAVADEADRRGYRFDRNKIVRESSGERLPVATGQLAYEWCHLVAKLQKRAPEACRRLGRGKTVQPHPIFYPVAGDVEAWEVGAAVNGRP